MLSNDSDFFGAKDVGLDFAVGQFRMLHRQHAVGRWISACGNEQVLPMVGNFIFVRPELLPGFLIKLNIKN